jgi:hypothetical protein
LHKTYLLTAKQGTVQNHYVLQEVNTLVFKDADALMENIHRVTTHLLKNYLRAKCVGDHGVYPNQDGGMYLKDEQGKCCGCAGMSSSYTVEVPKSTQQIYQSAGRSAIS